MFGRTDPKLFARQLRDFDQRGWENRGLKTQEAIDNRVIRLLSDMSEEKGALPYDGKYTRAVADEYYQLANEAEPQPINIERNKTMETTNPIATLNDKFRTALGIYGKVAQTYGIRSLPPLTQSAIREKVETYHDFTPDNDPYGEHDFGAFDHEAYRIYWKIDYYAPDLLHGSEDPSDPTQTTRVLTIMLSDEY